MESKFIDINEAYEHHDLACWYQSSVDDTPPIWTDEHLEELLNDFYVIPKDTSFVDIVTCKHCVAREDAKLEPFVCKRNNILVYGNSYCSYGIRREKDER